MEGIHPLVIVGRGGIVMELGELGRGEHLGRIGHHTCIWCPYQLTLVEGRGRGEEGKECYALATMDCMTATTFQTKKLLLFF